MRFKRHSCLDGLGPESVPGRPSDERSGTSCCALSQLQGLLAFCPAMISSAPITSQSALHLGLTGGIDNVPFKAEPDQPHSFGTGVHQNSHLSLGRMTLFHTLHKDVAWFGACQARQIQIWGLHYTDIGGGTMYWPCKELGASVVSVPIRASGCGKVCLASGQVAM